MDLCFVVFKDSLDTYGMICGGISKVMQIDMVDTLMFGSQFLGLDSFYFFSVLNSACTFLI